jgi:hypothetical protein
VIGLRTDAAKRTSSILPFVPLSVVTATHIRVVCDGCGTASAELCGRRELELIARANAVPKFRAAGWHQDPGEHVRIRTQEQVERDGRGRWYCPACARKTHL